MKKSIIGVLGGLGPQTTAEFYQALVDQTTVKTRPAICIWSLPMNLKHEQEYIASGKHTDYYFNLLTDGIERLTKAGCTQIVIPCNTVHEFHSRLNQLNNIPVANIIELTAKEVANRKWESCLILMTSRTRTTQLYQNSLTRRKVKVILPTLEEQLQLDQMIMGLLGPANNQKCTQLINQISKRINCQRIVLGCTDLQLICPPSFNVIDSMNELVKFSVKLVK